MTDLSHCWSGPCLVPFGVMEPEMRMCKVESVSDLIKNKAKTSYTVFFSDFEYQNQAEFFCLSQSNFEANSADTELTELIVSSSTNYTFYQI